MDYSQELSLSYYKTIAALNEKHKIFLVQHQETGKIYVKKILDVYNPDIYRTLFSHPVNGIPRIIDYFESDNSLIVIESYISGRTLSEFAEETRPDSSTITDLMVQLCKILETLHSMNPPVIHRDIKPSNIIVTDQGNLVLIDFNAAKNYTGPSECDTVLLGTAGYAAPEQYGFGSSTMQTDIYAAGVLLKELLDSSSDDSHQTEQLKSIAEKCTRLNPADRYDSFTTLKKVLEKAVSSKTSETSCPAHTRRYAPPGFRTRTPWKMLVALPSYVMIFFLSLTLEVENVYGSKLWVERITCLLMFLSFVMIIFNYMNVHAAMPLCRHRSIAVRILGITSLCFVAAIVLFTAMIFIESTFFS